MSKKSTDACAVDTSSSLRSAAAEEVREGGGREDRCNRATHHHLRSSAQLELHTFQLWRGVTCCSACRSGGWCEWLVMRGER